MTFYFYDLETSGINPRAQRIMQFAGQRTNDKLEPIGPPQNWLVKLTADILPDPQAVLLTGITPQSTQSEGYSEVEFLKLFMQEVFQPNTVFLGYNNVRFDDEFMRNTFWRNYYDPYKWQWQDGCSRWDLLDVVRMVRALRPDSIMWPVTDDGKPTNRLELLTEVNKLDHHNAHDAMNDVLATIEVARLIKSKQPKIFNYLFRLRSKKEVQQLSRDKFEPFVYTSGRYSSSHLHTAAVCSVGEMEHGNMLVFDLRYDPVELDKLNDSDLIQYAFMRSEHHGDLIVKTLKPNACPAVAPIKVIDKASEERLDMNLSVVWEHSDSLKDMPKFVDRLNLLYEEYLADKIAGYDKYEDPEFQIYDGFVGPSDQNLSQTIVNSEASEIAGLKPSFEDKRLQAMWPRYVARNFNKYLDPDSRGVWSQYRSERIMRGLPGQLSMDAYLKSLNELAISTSTTDRQFIIDELQLWANSIIDIE